eukprot:scaffold23781_cov17-Tisochrysis_lutea.AAC.1
MMVRDHCGIVLADGTEATEKMCFLVKERLRERMQNLNASCSHKLQRGQHECTLMARYHGDNVLAGGGVVTSPLLVVRERMEQL